MLHRFLLTILPSSELSAAVDRLRDLLHSSIGSFSGRHTPPHITLGFLDLPGAYEADIIRTIGSGLAGQRSFALHYKGITHFPDRRTIYIDPVEKEPIAALRRPMVFALKADDRLREAVRETDHPHLTIAAGLKPAQFAKAWELLAPVDISGEGMVAEVVLMKRLLQPGERYVHVCTFPLHP